MIKRNVLGRSRQQQEDDSGCLPLALGDGQSESFCRKPTSPHGQLASESIGSPEHSLDDWA